MSAPQTPSAEVKLLAAAGRKIEAIRQYRRETGASLREAKRVVDAIPRSGPAGNGLDPLSPAERVSRSAAAFLAATILGIAGASLTSIGLYRTDRASGWPVVTGEIVSATAIRNGLGISGRVAVEYAYAVGDRPYRGDRVRFADLSGAGLGGPGERYSPGQAVTVHYDPAQPGNAVLDTEVPLLYWLVFGGSLLAGAWGLREWGVAARRERDARNVLR